MHARRVGRTAIPLLLAFAVIALPAGAAASSSPATPTLRIAATTSSTATLEWTTPKSGAGISYYQVLEKSTWSHFTVMAPQTTFTRTRLVPNVTHGWVVIAVDMRGPPSGESNMVTYRTPPDVTAPSAFTLSPSFVGPKLAELDWTDSVDDTSHVTYTVTVNGSTAQTGVSLSRTIVSLSPSTPYTISVTAKDRYGNAITSNTIEIQTPAADNTSPPSPPGNLLGLEVGNCEGWLSWTASTDDVDPSSAIRYDAYVNGQFDSSAFGYTSTIVYATQNGTNTFTIIAVDSSGNQSQPSTVEIPNMWLC
jgi:hypothetical protein